MWCDFRFLSRRLLQDVSNSTADVCDSSVGKRKLVVTWGQSVHLGCFVKMPEVLANQEVRWYHYSKEKGRYQIAYKYGAGGDKFIETSEKGLVIVGVNEQDAGRYDCWLGGALLCSYNITVDAHRCSAPAKSNDYQKIYSDWCHEFEKYKSAMKSWERKQAVSRFYNLLDIFKPKREIATFTRTCASQTFMSPSVIYTYLFYIYIESS
jgi:hypothetical protein